MTRVLVLGPSGMLGRALVSLLRTRHVDVITGGRGQNMDYYFDAEVASPADLLSNLQPGDFVVNAIGLITHRIDESKPEHVRKAFQINAVFPKSLADIAARLDLKVIQIATDCVFDGSRGNYDEASPHDASDTYGLSKSEGEVSSPSMMHIRCSIVGPESGRNLSLFEWVRSQDRDATLTGYSDHLWNGVTTYAFSRVVEGIIRNNLFTPGVHHLVPSDKTSKADLIRMMARRAGRDDLTVFNRATGFPIDRTLATNDEEFNSNLWSSAGYSHIPSIAELIEEMPIN